VAQEGGLLACYRWQEVFGHLRVQNGARLASFGLKALLLPQS